MEAGMAICPECEARLDLEQDEVEEGEVINCPECGQELEIVNTDPIEVERVEEEEEQEQEDEELEEEEGDWK